MRYLLITTCFVVSMPSFANQTGIDYQKDQSIIADNESQVMNSATHFNTNVLPNYNPNPSQTGYYHGVDQYDSDLTAQGESHLKDDIGGRTVYQNFATRPQININTQSSSIQTAKLIESDSYNLTHGIPDKNTDCQKHSVNCHITYKQETCIQSHPVELSCTKTAIPRVRTVVVPAQDIPFHSTGQTDERHDQYWEAASFTFPMTGILKSFSITANGGFYGHFTVTIPPIVGTIDAHLASSATYSFKNLSLKVTKDQKGKISFWGREYRDSPNITTQYSGVIEVPSYKKREVYITWSNTNCP